MYRALDMRLASALMKKDLAIKKKQKSEAISQLVLAYEDFRLEKIMEDSKKWKQESLEIFKFLEFLIDHEHVVDMLEGELLSSNRNLSLLHVSTSSLRYNKPEGNTNMDFETDIKNEHGVSDITEDGHGKNKLRKSDV